MCPAPSILCAPVPLPGVVTAYTLLMGLMPPRCCAGACQRLLTGSPCRTPAVPQPSLFGSNDGQGHSLVYYFALPEGWEPSQARQGGRARGLLLPERCCCRPFWAGGNPAEEPARSCWVRNCVASRGLQRRRRGRQRFHLS